VEEGGALCIWANQPKNELVAHLFGRQAIPMAWDYAEANPFSASGGNFEKNLSYVAKGIDHLAGAALGHADQADAATNTASSGRLVSTDPPYYDNIGYADLSDYFYVWLRHSLRRSFPELFATLAVPKAEELVATPYRHGGKEQAEVFFLDGMTRAMARLAEQSHPAFPVTIYYAFKQSETETDSGTASTGWETFLDAAIRAGFAVEKMKMELPRARPLRRAGRARAHQHREKRKSCRHRGDREPGDGPGRNLKPWREVSDPHKDVASGRYQQAEFAADLWQVHIGEGSTSTRSRSSSSAART
jgi:hypothetical protein